jgi:hypothetical protein
MVNFLYYYCWRVVSEVHNLGWILVSVRNMVPTLTSNERRGLSLNGRC